jgi:thiol-disulfide isomerase/thioredoxin
MKIWRSLLLVAFAVLLTACGADAVDIYNRPIKMSNYEGKWVVISYWATWCPACIGEIPALNTLAKYYKDQVVVFAVNPDNLSDDVLRNLTESYGVQYLFLRSFPIDKWGGKVQKLPVTFILDKKGRLYKTLETPLTIQDLKKIMSLPDVNYD